MGASNGEGDSVGSLVVLTLEVIPTDTALALLIVRG